MNDGTISRGGSRHGIPTRKAGFHNEHRRYTYRKGYAVGGNPAAAQRAAAQRAAKAAADAAKRATAQRVAAEKAAAAQRTAAAAKEKAEAAAAKAKADAAAKKKKADDDAKKKKADKDAADAKKKADKDAAAAKKKADKEAADARGAEDAKNKCIKTGKEYISGKCLAKCPQGQIRSGTTCKDDASVDCPAGQKKDPKKGCVPNPNENCPAGQRHDGKRCVDGDPPPCSSGKERVGASCVAPCRVGMKRKVGTTKSEDDPSYDCPDGEVNKRGRGCVNPSTGFTGLGLSNIIPPPGSFIAGVGTLALAAGGLYAYNKFGGNEIVGSLNKVKGAFNNFKEITDTFYGWLGAPVNPVIVY